MAFFFLAVSLAAIIVPVSEPGHWHGRYSESVVPFGLGA